MSQSKRQAKSMSFASMKQRRANRANAQKSTGPRTDGGKRRAALNSVSHGVFCKDAVLPGESRGEFVAFRNLLLASPGLMPQDWLELSIAEQYVLAKWRMRRLQSAELLVHHDVATDVAAQQLKELKELASAAEPPAAEPYSLLARYGTRTHGDDDEDDEDDIAQVLDRRQRAFELAERQHVPVQATLAATLCVGGKDGKETGAFERVARNLYRLELCASRALRELRQLRKEKGVDVSKLAGCPFLDPIPDDADERERADAAERLHRETVQCITETLSALDALRAEANEDEKDDDENADDEDDEHAKDATDAGGRGGVVTSVTTASPPRGSSETHPNAPSNAPVQNEPNSVATPGTPDAIADCAQGSCNIVPIVPTRLAPGGAGEAGDASDDQRGGADRT